MNRYEKLKLHALIDACEGVLFDPNPFALDELRTALDQARKLETPSVDHTTQRGEKENQDSG